MAYTQPAPGRVDAGHASTANTCRFADQKVWTAGMNTPGTVDIIRVDGDTGAIEATVTITDGSRPDNYGIYGGAVDARGNFWGSQLGLGQAALCRLRDARVHRSWDMVVGGYGMTVDSKGYVWTCAGNGVALRPDDRDLGRRSAAGEYGGCMEDGNGTLYKATPGGIVAIDTETLTIKQTLRAAAARARHQRRLLRLRLGRCRRGPTRIASIPPTGSFRDRHRAGRAPIPTAT
jgi:hypothetical protein